MFKKKILKVLDAYIDNTHILVWSMEESIVDILSILPYSEKIHEHLGSLKNLQRRKEFLFTRYLIFLLFGELKEIIYSADGKPSFADNSANISISHSKNFAAVAINSSREIGLDIEIIGKQIDRLRTRFLSTKELMDLQTDINLIKTHVYWSAKESVYKLIGKVVVDFRNSIEISPFELSETNFTARIFPIRQTLAVEYRLFDGFVLTLATI